MSLEASGTLSSSLTFQKSLKSVICRRIPIPKYSRTSEQSIVRNTVSKAVSHWKNLTLQQKEIWRAYLDGYGYKGYHSFIHQFINRTNDGLAQFQLPPDKTYCLVGEWKVGELVCGGVWIDP